MEEATLQASGNGASRQFAPIQWYSRPALDEYLASAERERNRLRATIDDANSRLARASAAVGLHQTMLEMLLESQREITEIRRAADAEAARIMVEGDREAQAVFRAGTERNGAAPTIAPDAPPVATAEPASPPDLQTTPEAPQASAVDPLASTSADADDAFFTYLKGALAEDEPLGPGPQ